MKLQRTIMEDYQCPVCKNVVQVIRPEGRRRDKLHLKSMFCPFCNKDINHHRVNEYLGRHWHR